MRLRTKGPGGGTADHVARAATRADDGIDYYDGVAIGAGMLGERALSPEIRAEALDVLGRLTADDYSEYLRSYVERGEELGGTDWRYADIITVLRSAATLLEPSSYLEIGVRRGRSMAIVADACPDCSIIGIDMWIDDYAGMDNPGPDYIREEMQRFGHRGELELISGNSHDVVPELFHSRPELAFDLITVDGDHSSAGARDDLRTVLPRLRVGGVLVFDDIRHRHHPDLWNVWRSTVAADRRYSCWEFDEVGYGVAFAVRRW